MTILGPEDSAALLESLANGCSAEEMDRRVEWARKRLGTVDPEHHARLAARLETALGLLREVVPAGSHQHVGDCWFCRVKAILATIDADTAHGSDTTSENSEKKGTQ